MICAFPCHQGDIDALLNLLEWIGQLGGCKGHNALLVADAKTDFKKCAKAKELLKASFSEVRCITNGRSVTGWPKGPNSLFWAAATYIGCGWQIPWLFMETDAVPLKEGWLDAIANEYATIHHPFMGDVYHGLAANSGMPVRAVSGVAVYPSDAASRLKNSDREAWDMANREYLLANTHATALIKHFYGTSTLPPVFVSEKTSQTPPHAFTPDQIRKEAVIWHRNKDGSLIRELRKKRGIRDCRIDVAYTCVSQGPASEQLAKRFAETYAKFDPGVAHHLYIICNGGPLPDAVRVVLAPLNPTFFPRPNIGRDIGGYIDFAKKSQADLVICLGESVFFHRNGWLKRIVEAWRQHGPGYYGFYGSDLLRPHLPTTAFGCTPSMLAAAPMITSHDQAYEFEHGVNAFWKSVKKNGNAVKLVTFSGIWDEPQWRKVPNGLWSGDQSDCLAFCNHTERFVKATTEIQEQLTLGINGGPLKYPAFRRRNWNQDSPVLK